MKDRFGWCGLVLMNDVSNFVHDFYQRAEGGCADDGDALLSALHKGHC